MGGCANGDRVVALAPYKPPAGGTVDGGTGTAPLVELLPLELSLELSPLPPPRNKRSCRFVNRFQNESLSFFVCMFHLPFSTSDKMI